jgi:O-antigen/teichoic acid export membrane protein
MKIFNAIAGSRLVKKLAGMFPKGKFGRNVTVLAGGAILGQGITLAASPVITRFYDPSDFGVLAVYASIVGVVYVIASWRYELAMPLPEDDRIAINVAALSTGLLLATSVSFGALVLLFGDALVSWTNTPVFARYLWLLPVGIFLAGLYQVLNFWAVRRGNFKMIARTKFNQSFGQAIIQVCAVFVVAGPLGLLAGDVAGRVSGSGTLLIKFLKDDKALLRFVSFNVLKEIATRYVKFPLYSGSSALLNNAATLLPAILLAGFFGPKTAGWFALGQRVINAPLSFVSLSVSQVYMNEAARLAREDRPAFKELFTKTARRLFAVGIVPIAILALGGPWLFGIVFGESWSNAGVFLRILAVMLVFQFVSSPLSYTLDILERQGWELIWNTGRLVFSIGGMVAAYYLGYSANVAIGVYSTIMVAVYVALLVISYLAVQKHIDAEEKPDFIKIISDCA